MKHGFFFFSITLVCALLLIPSASADDSLPTWSMGSWWEYTTVTDIHMEQTSGDSVDIVMTDSATRYTVISEETVTLSHGTAQTYWAYVLDYSNTYSATGTYHTTSPIPLDIPIEIRNGTVTGTWWVDAETLGTVYFYRYLVGELWANIPFQGWQQIGTADIKMNEEYEPPRDECNFPIDVGNTWLQSVTFFTYGHYILDYDIGSGPQHAEDDFEGSETYSFSMDVTMMETINGRETYRVTGDDTGSDGAIRNNYAPSARNTAYELLENLGSGEEVRINQMERTLIALNLAPDPTPTPIPPTPTPPPGEPTYTPLPSTPTPVPGELGIDLNLNSDLFTPGDLFLCQVSLSNPGPELVVHEYVILDVYGSYWFWPSWSQVLDYRERTLDENEYYPFETILSFTWPGETGSASGLRLWAALLNPVTGQLAGQYDMEEWGYEGT